MSTANRASAGHAYSDHWTTYDYYEKVHATAHTTGSPVPDTATNSPATIHTTAATTTAAVVPTTKGPSVQGYVHPQCVPVDYPHFTYSVLSELVCSRKWTLPANIDFVLRFADLGTLARSVAGVSPGTTAQWRWHTTTQPPNRARPCAPATRSA